MEEQSRNDRASSNEDTPVVPGFEYTPEEEHLKKYETSFVGTYIHTLDNKGRLVIPQPFRETLGPTFYIAPSKDFSHVALYPNLAWARVRDSFAKLGSFNPLVNMFLDQFDALSFRGQECDAQGRILLPQRVRDELLHGEKDVEITGANDHVRVVAATFAQKTRVDFRTSLPDILKVMAEAEARNAGLNP